jgi:hypothetical protein
MGRWNVHNRFLCERLAGSDEWDEFEATSVARPLLDGLGNEDEFRTDSVYPPISSRAACAARARDVAGRG